MKSDISPKKEWHCAKQDLTARFNPLNKQLNRLMMLDYVWKKLVGDKEKFWTLHAVQQGTLFIQVSASVAKNELNARKKQLIFELNKYFDTPWIKEIKIK